MESQPVHITSGLNESNISDKYYEPPLMQVIPSACAACEESGYEVSDQCRGCVAHPCQEVCPRGNMYRLTFRSKRHTHSQTHSLTCDRALAVNTVTIQWYIRWCNAVWNRFDIIINILWFKHIVARHFGKIWVTSDEVKKTCFYIEFPECSEEAMNP